jgi:excisionase family DNA binding protein
MKDLMTTEELAAYIGVKPSTIIRWRTDRKGPKYFKNGEGRAPVIYRKSDVDAWMETRMVEPGE